MLISEFDYHLPPELIAQTPLPKRDRSRMMICDRDTGEINHSHFFDIPKYLKKDDMLVLNSSKVIPAKVWGQKEDGRSIEFLFLKETSKNTWEVLCRPAKRVELGDEISFAKDTCGQVIGTEPEGKRVIRFPHGEVISLLKKTGFAPLPPYIKRKKKDILARPEDLDRYQTVFARKDGSIAAPTAGLHFTKELLDELEEKGVTICELSLDVGQATFQPVRIHNVKDYRMLSENYAISKETAKVINDGINANHSITAVGTTSVRALESAYEGASVRAGHFETELFIFPGYEFKVVDRLLTNFHLPKSTLLMLVSAFAGRDFILRAYREAVRQKYRFYSYGDCMLIL
ncbi:MAG: tRNA preQ1(34) S-adenosylmethionine ribosyltransferase-isomerase QueA [Candidatus Aminicenantes bacterium]|nr:MAG: tRNA preQ1(34) S-adenosylmethionine ribosyltransferase-isomerase QueA [Candidatus Aminicenantes bacterium]